MKKKFAPLLLGFITLFGVVCLGMSFTELRSESKADTILTVTKYLGDWDVPDDPNSAEGIARTLAWLEGVVWKDIVSCTPEEIVSANPEYEAWTQYLVALRLHIYERYSPSLKDEYSKDAVLKWAKANGYWSDTYVAPYENWNLDILKDSFVLLENNCINGFYHDNVRAKDGDRKLCSDYYAYESFKAETGFLDIEYRPSKIKYVNNPDLPYGEQISYPLLNDNGRLGKYFIYYDKDTGHIYGIGKTDGLKSIGCIADKNVYEIYKSMKTEEERRYFSCLAYNWAYSYSHWSEREWEISVKDSSYQYNVEVTKRIHGWEFNGEIAEDTLDYMLEFLAETHNPWLKTSKYADWYKEWLKTYDGTAGNYKLLTSLCKHYEEWYKEYLKKYYPSIKMEEVKAPTPTPIPEPTKTPDKEVTPTPVPVIETLTPTLEEIAESLDEPSEDGTHIHDYIPYVIKEATCGEEGTVNYICSDENCDSVIEDTIPPLTHDYQIVDQADKTCTLDGYTIYECQNCGDTYTDIDSAEGHKWVAVDSKEATCEVDGYIESVCDVCGESYTENIPMLGHDWEITETVTATCEAEGHVTRHCDNCGTDVTEKIERLQHKEAERTVTEAGFFNEGKKEYYCTECNEVLRTEVIPATVRPWYYAVAAVVVAGLVIGIIAISRRRR